MFAVRLLMFTYSFKEIRSAVVVLVVVVAAAAARRQADSGCL